MHGFVHRIALVAAGLAILPACDTEKDDVRGLIEDAIDEENRSFEVLCDCWQELGDASRSECLDVQILPSQRRCIEDAYLQDTAAAKTYLECFVPLLREQAECLNDRLTCDDVDPAFDCIDDFRLGARNCIELPAAIQRDLEECTGRSSSNDGGTGGTTDPTTAGPGGGTTTVPPDSTADDGPAPPDTFTTGAEGSGVGSGTYDSGPATTAGDGSSSGGQPAPGPG